MRRKKQNILEMEFNDSEPDSDEEPVENDHQQEVQVKPARKRNKVFDLVEHHVREDTVLRVIHRAVEFNCYWAARKPFITAKNVAKRVACPTADTDCTD